MKVRIVRTMDPRFPFLVQRSFLWMWWTVGEWLWYSEAEDQVKEIKRRREPKAIPEILYYEEDI